MGVRSSQFQHVCLPLSTHEHHGPLSYFVEYHSMFPHHDCIREHAAIPTNVAELAFGERARQVHEASIRRPGRSLSFPFGSFGRQWCPVLSCEPRAFHRRIILGDVESRSSRTVRLPLAFSSLRPCFGSTSRSSGERSVLRAIISKRYTRACVPCRPGNPESVAD